MDAVTRKRLRGSKIKPRNPSPREARRPTLSEAEQRRLDTATPNILLPVTAMIDRATAMGLITANTHQVGARLPTALLAQAKKRTGIASTTDLLTFALATIAVEDEFAEAFAAARGTLDPDLDVGL